MAFTITTTTVLIGLWLLFVHILVLWFMFSTKYHLERIESRLRPLRNIEDLTREMLINPQKVEAEKKNPAMDRIPPEVYHSAVQPPRPRGAYMTREEMYRYRR